MANEKLRWMKSRNDDEPIWISTDNKTDWYAITMKEDGYKVRYHISATSSSEVGNGFPSLAEAKAAAEEHYKKEVLK